MGALILFKAGNILVGIFMDTASISRFSIAVSAIMLISSITQMFSRAVKPAVSDLDARGDTARMKEIAFLTQKYTLLMIIPSCCFLVVMAREFLGVWVGAKIRDAAVLDMMASIMAIMAVAQAVRMAQHSNYIVLVGRGYHKIFGVFTISTAVIFIILAVICLKVFNLGLVAVAWCNFIPLVLVSGIILPAYFNRRMQITMAETIKRVWGPALWGTLPTALLITTWKVIAPPQSWPQLVGVVAAAGTLTLVSSWFFSLMPAERQRFGRVLGRK
jgi:O-antigen/teichoic acid export membrane protein